jgi:hypothetical protein
MRVVVMQLACVGERDCCGEFGLGVTALQFELTDPVVQPGVGQVDQPGNNCFEHDANCTERTCGR